MSIDLLTTAEVAARLRKSSRFVRDELGRKHLRGSRFGGEWRISEADLAAYVEAHLNMQPVARRRRRRSA